jgi:ankyrin repeat protein
MNVNNIKKNMCALFLAMSVSATAYAGDAPGLSDQSIIEAQNRLSIACQNGHMEDVISAIGAGADINAQNFGLIGFRPLHSAIRYGHLSVCEYLIGQGADVNARTDRWETSLHLAGERGHVEVCRLLVDSGARINARCVSKRTPLHGASKNGHLSVCQYLIENGADVNGRYRDESTEILRYLRNRDEFKEMPLHLRDHFYAGLPQEIGEIGDPTLYRSDYACTPLHLASRYGHLPICRYLIENGADLKLADSKFRTALSLAATDDIKTIFKNEELWWNRILALWLASEHAPPNLLQRMPGDVARYIISQYL